MRLALVVNALNAGGAEIQTVALASALQTHGHSSVLLPLLPSREIDVPNDLDVAHIGGNGLTNCSAIKRLALSIDRCKADVIIAVNTRPLIYSHLARALSDSRPPIIAVFHTTILPDRKQRLNHLLALPMFKRSDALIYVSANQKLYWEQRGLRAKRVEIILNGIDTNRFSPSIRKSARDGQRAVLGYEPCDYVIGMSAAFRPEKNHAQAIDAIAALRAKSVPAKLLLVGDGPMIDATHSKAQALGILDAVQFAGRQKDVVPWLAAFDVGLLTSTAETFSLAALEAMAMEVPMVMSDIGGASEMVHDGLNGHLFPAGDTGRLVQALQNLSDPVIRLTAGRAAARIVSACFNHKRMVKRYDALIRELVRTHGTPVAG